MVKRPTVSETDCASSSPHNNAHPQNYPSSNPIIVNVGTSTYQRDNAGFEDGAGTSKHKAATMPTITPNNTISRFGDWGTSSVSKARTRIVIPSMSDGMGALPLSFRLDISHSDLCKACMSKSHLCMQTNHLSTTHNHSLSSPLQSHFLFLPSGERSVVCGQRRNRSTISIQRRPDRVARKVSVSVKWDGFALFAIGRQMCVWRKFGEGWEGGRGECVGCGL
ncbi:hypothetical protein BLNAU_10757 [Blattamonas nauphoetae]|uniref:Uncharacterized protein n=1 Tax=Blattamonas nauphoetae TaxID=2049346 RepID=A0ABQ9XRU0_9EUKA|nr:hypothetical protein BLNAU_10757 [Blattamonas nauphoetae]